MTTEVAVSNRLGIALATDSAVTITGRGHVKVFDTADKLFELSGKYPVAVMINGNMDCMGTPWEILVKNFREKHGSDSKGSIEKWATDFLAYVEAHDPLAEDSEGGFIDRSIRAEISAVQKKITQFVRTYIMETAAQSDHAITKRDLNIPKLLEAAIQLRNEELNSFQIVDTLSQVTSDALLEKYGARISSHLDAMYRGQQLADAQKTPLIQLVISSLVRDTDIVSPTGVVVAGYGADEVFPAIFSCEIDGRLLGKLKIHNRKLSLLSDAKYGGLVTSFAQADVTERLLKGADPRFVDRSAEFIHQAVSDAVTKTFAAVEKRKPNKKAAEARNAVIEEMARAAAEKYVTSSVEQIKDNFSREFEWMIAAMPKQELVEFAEALVSITVIERKAADDEGTVGGPVDVALITKHEGFVWIKRKHHFPRDLNPRYFWRKFGDPRQPGNCQ